MGGRLLSPVWSGFEQIVDPYKTGIRDKCKACGLVIQGLVRRISKHKHNFNIKKLEEYSLVDIGACKLNDFCQTLNLPSFHQKYIRIKS